MSAKMSLRWGEMLLGMAALVATNLLAISVTIMVVIAMHNILVWWSSRQTRSEVIEVCDSPAPTRTQSSPRASPPIMKSKLRRAGQRRIRCHRRRATHVYSPKHAGHCGYQAVLWAAGSAPTAKNVYNLRRYVAEEFVKARLAGERILGIDPHDILRAEEMTLKMYEELTKTSMWASKVELHIAAQYLQVGLIYTDKHAVQQIGVGKPAHMIRLENSHFTISKLHRPIKTKPSSSLGRGGMTNDWISWQWQGIQQPSEQSAQTTLPVFVDLLQLESFTASTVETDDSIPEWARTSGEQYVHPIQRENPSFFQEEVEEYYAPADNLQTVQYKVDVKISYTEMSQVTFNMNKNADIKSIRRPVSAAIGIAPHGIMFTLPNEDDELPDWVNLPELIEVKMRPGHIPSQLVRAHVPQRGYTVLLDVSTVSPRSSIRQQMSTITGVPPDAVRVLEQNGEDIPDKVLPGQSVMISLPMERAGMRNTISTTELYGTEGQQEQSDSSEEMHRTFWRDMVESAGHVYTSPPRGRRESSPSSSSQSPRSRSPARSLATGNASPSRHSWYSGALPQELPPAQHDSVCRPVIDMQKDLPIGYIWANPTATTADVVRTMKRDLSIVADISSEPEAESWQEVTRLTMDCQPPLGVPYYIDLRIDRWELYQLPRAIPVMHAGKIEMFLVVPHVLDLQAVQRRIDHWQPIIFSHIVTALDMDNWVIVKRTHPAAYRNHMMEIASQLPRGGMQRTIEQLDTSHYVPRPWASDRFIIIWMDLAHAPSHSFVPYVADRRVSVWRLRRALSYLLQVDETEVLLSNHNAPLDLNDILERIMTGPIIVHLRERVEAGDYNRYPVQWPFGPEIDTLSTSSSPPTPSVIPSPYLRRALILTEPDHDVEQQEIDTNHHLMRGGVRGRNMSDPRTAMLVWAQQRVARELPHLNQAIITALLRGDNRMVCAVLNARSTHQLTEVVTAACRRAGIAEMMDQPPPAQPQQPQQDQQLPHPQQQDVLAPEQPAPQQQGPPVQMQPVIDALTQHTQNLNTIVQYISNQPNNHDFQNMMTVMHMQNQAQIQAIAGFTTVLARMERRITEWEGYIRPPVPQQERVPTTPGAETVVGDQDLRDTQEYHDEHMQHQEDAVQTEQNVQDPEQQPQEQEQEEHAEAVHGQQG